MINLSISISFFENQDLPTDIVSEPETTVISTLKISNAGDSKISRLIKPGRPLCVGIDETIPVQIMGAVN